MRLFRRPSAKNIGFTLIELMIVVAIIGILASIAIPKFASLVRKAQEGATKGSLSSIRAALQIYYGDMEGLFPSNPSVGAAPGAYCVEGSSFSTCPTTGALMSLTINGKYLSAFPTVRMPPYHSPYSGYSGVSLVVDAYGAWGTPTSFYSGTAISDTSGNTAFYVYFSDSNPAWGSNSAWGTFYIWCMHTDTIGTSWSAY
jgi:prepilin-type N-terminal cleavage/methylation domain-containing protein